MSYCQRCADLESALQDAREELATERSMHAAWRKRAEEAEVHADELKRYVRHVETCDVQDGRFRSGFHDERCSPNCQVHRVYTAPVIVPGLQAALSLAQQERDLANALASHGYKADLDKANQRLASLEAERGEMLRQLHIKETLRNELAVQVRDADESLKAFGFPARGDDHAARVDKALRKLASLEAGIGEIAQQMRSSALENRSVIDGTIVGWADALSGLGSQQKDEKSTTKS